MRTSNYTFLQSKNYRYINPIKGLQGCEVGYSFAFNGMEKDDEVNVEGNTYDFGARIYDSRSARFYSIDPRYKEFTDLSPYQYAANSPIANIDEDGKGPGYGTLKMLAQNSHCTITAEYGGSIEIGIIKTVSTGMAVDPNGNVLLYSSKSIGSKNTTMFNAGANVNVKTSILPGIDDVRGLMGNGASLTLSVGIPTSTCMSFAGGAVSLEKSGENWVGLGVSLSAGVNVGYPASWSYVNTFTKATAMTGSEYLKIQDATSWSKAYSNTQNWNSKINTGIWEVGDMKLEYVKRKVKGTTLYEAVINTEYRFKPTQGDVNSTTLETKTNTGVFFEMDSDGNMTSTKMEEQK